MPILTNRKTFIRKPLRDLDEDKLVFYDYETDHQYGPYAKLKMGAAQYGLSGAPILLETEKQWREFRSKIASPDVVKVDFNGVNFDRVVSSRHNLHIHPQNSHDIFLMVKTVCPLLPAYGMKFVMWYYLADLHLPEGRLNQWMGDNPDCGMYQAPKEILGPYNRHDITQTKDLFRIFWDHVITDEYWEPYLEDLMMGEPLHEMELEGGLFLDRDEIWRRLHLLQKKVQKLTERAIKLTRGKVQNPNSSQQLGAYLTKIDKIELEVTESGEFCVKKAVLVALMDENELADIAFQIREANGTIKYFENYLNALDDTTYPATQKKNWIPVQFSVSSAKTRRFTSQSLHRLNFQNPNDKAKEVQLVPPGYLGFWIDATQIENVVHIYESKDWARRKEYEADPKWNEYVWLCNEILGTNKTKEELDDKEQSRSPQIPNWTLYKQYKTGKLGINFGMGIGLFCKLFGLSRSVGVSTFQDIHTACPAIRELQERVAYDLSTRGHVNDVFGKRYSGPPRMAYKVVAYLIQGCGTGSLPKAQIRSNWETLRRFDKRMPERLRRNQIKCGVMAGTTHDENSGRIDLRLGPDNILQLLQKIHYNMTEKYSHLFDNIPLRAKLYLSRTTADEDTREEVDIKDIKTILKYAER